MRNSRHGPTVILASPALDALIAPSKPTPLVSCSSALSLTASASSPPPSPSPVASPAADSSRAALDDIRELAELYARKMALSVRNPPRPLETAASPSLQQQQPLSDMTSLASTIVASLSSSRTLSSSALQRSLPPADKSSSPATPSLSSSPLSPLPSSSLSSPPSSASSASGAAISTSVPPSLSPFSPAMSSSLSSLASLSVSSLQDPPAAAVICAAESLLSRLQLSHAPSSSLLQASANPTKRPRTASDDAATTKEASVVARYEGEESYYWRCAGESVEEDDTELAFLMEEQVALQQRTVKKPFMPYIA